MAIQTLDFPPEFPAILFDYEIPGTLHDIHWHDCLEVGLIVSGRGTFYIEEKRIPFEAGDLFLINRLEGHRAHATDGKGARARFIYIGDRFIETLLPLAPGVDFWKLFSISGPLFENRFRDDAIAGALMEACDEAGKEDALSKPLARTAVAKLLMLLARKFQREWGAHPPDSFTEKIPMVLNHIQTHLTADLGAAALADACGLSEAHFRKRFKEVLGKSPRAWVEERRLFHARRLMDANGRRAKEAAAEAGFADYSAFQRRYKERFGENPSRG